MPSNTLSQPFWKYCPVSKMHWHRVHSQFGRYSFYMARFWKYIGTYIYLIKYHTWLMAAYFRNSTFWKLVFLPIEWQCFCQKKRFQKTLLPNAMNKHFSIKKWQTKVHCVLKVNSCHVVVLTFYTLRLYTMGWNKFSYLMHTDYIECIKYEFESEIVNWF